MVIISPLITRVSPTHFFNRKYIFNPGPFFLAMLNYRSVITMVHFHPLRIGLVPRPLPFMALKMAYRWG